MQPRNRAEYTIAGHELVNEGADLRVADCAAISLSLWRAQNAIYHGSGYSKGAGDVRNLHSRPERRANEICCSFRNLLNPRDLVIAGGRSLAL